MRGRWLNSRKEPLQVFEVAKDFFKRRDLRIEEYSVRDGFGFTAYGRITSSLPLARVEVYGNSDAMTVDYYQNDNSRQSSLLRAFSPLMTLFGGGFLVLQDSKKNEILDKIENEFWSSLDEFFSSN